MMMMELADHKRRSHHDGFDLGNFTGEKRPKVVDDGGATISMSTKKKDRIGERVAKLQQLVSPFGKSDTASVLSEATSYIRFLHEQVQVLSAPYLRRTVAMDMEEGDGCSLGSRGLCLMPVASTYGVAQSNGADLWAPLNTSRKTCR